MAKTETQKRKEHDLRTKFEAMYGKRDDKGARIHGYQHCINTVAHEFYLAPSTAQKIINSPA